MEIAAAAAAAAASRSPHSQHTPAAAYPAISPATATAAATATAPAGSGGGGEGQPLLLLRWWQVATVALAVRLAFVALGCWMDGQASRRGLPRYTDLDYTVFTDAAEFVLQGRSPYERATYRYPPLLAVLLTPNHVVFAEFGKLLFSLADALIVGVIHFQLSPVCAPATTALWTWLWALNPISISICTRGSSDSIANLLMLLTILLLRQNRWRRAALVTGFLIYWRIYPVIYLPSITIFIAFRAEPCSRPATWLRAIHFCLLAALAFLACAFASYACYGEDYLEHALLYHLTRRDHRHNFSLYFYSIYLQLSQELALLADATTTTAATAGVAAVASGLSVAKVAASLAAFAPQLLLNLAVGLLLFKNHLSLESTLFLQTLIFVAYNKVITAQYFTWFLCLVPVTFHSLSLAQLHEHSSLGRTVLIWLAAMALWLALAYCLEFRALNTFAAVWIASILFHFATVALIVQALRLLVFSAPSHLLHHHHHYPHSPHLSKLNQD